MENNCVKHKSKAILFCIDDKCCKTSRLLCSKCENNNEHDNHQLELIEDIPKKLNRCILQEFPQEKLLSSVKNILDELQNRLNNLIVRYKEQLCLYIKEECQKIGQLLSKGKSFSSANYANLEIPDQELFIDLLNNRIGFDEVIQNTKQRSIHLEQVLSTIQQTLQERLTLSSFRKSKTLEILLPFCKYPIQKIYSFAVKNKLANLSSKSFCMLNDEQFVIGEDDGCIKLIDLQTNTQIISVELKSVASHFSIEKISSNQIAAYEKSSHYIEIVDFNALQGKNIVLLKNKDLVTTLKTLVFGEILAIGFQNGLLKIFNYKEKSFLTKIDCNVDNLNRDLQIECIDSLNNLIVVGGLSGFINVWNWRTGSQVAVVKKAFSNDDIANKYSASSNANQGRSILQVLFLNEKEIISKGEQENSFSFHSLIHQNLAEYPLNYINVVRFLQPTDFNSIIVKKPVFQIPLDFESFTNECSRDKIIFIQKDYRKIGRILQIYNHSSTKVQFQQYFERNSQIVGAYLTSKQLLIIYQDGLIEGYV